MTHMPTFFENVSRRSCRTYLFSGESNLNSGSDDMLHGAAEIAQFLFGDSRHRRKVYYLIEAGRLPVLRLNGICARKSTLLAWLKNEETAAMKSTRGLAR